MSVALVVVLLVAAIFLFKIAVETIINKKEHKCNCNCGDNCKCKNK